MPINASVSGQPQIQANVGETQIDVSVSGGFGPSGSSGTVAVSAPITNSGTSTAAVIGISAGNGLSVSGGSLTVNYGTSSSSACRGDDARLSDSREWSAATATQAEAEAGTSTARRAFTPLRVFQAVAAWWAASPAKTKLDGIQSGATANATDAQLRDRSTHTGTQLASTISDFTTAVVAAAPPTTNASLLTSGILPDARLSSSIARTSDVTSAVASVVNAAPASLDTLKELADALGNDASFASTVTNSLAAKAPINNPTFTGTVGGVTKSHVGLSNVPNVDATARANHTGTQAISTISGLQTALDKKTVSVTVGRSGADYVCSGTSSSVTDHTQIQAAIDSIAATGGRVVIREGTYYLGATINITAPNIEIVGMGRSTQLRAMSDYGNVFLCALSTPPTSWPGLSGLAFRSLRFETAVARTTGAAIRANYTHDAQFHDLYICDTTYGVSTADTAGGNPFFDGIYLQYQDQCDVANVTAQCSRYSVYLSGSGFASADFSYDGIVRDCDFYGVYVDGTFGSPNGTGVYVDNNSGGVVVSNCSMNMLEYGVHAVMGATHTQGGGIITIRGGYVENSSQHGYRIVNYQNATVSDLWGALTLVDTPVAVVSALSASTITVSGTTNAKIYGSPNSVTGTGTWTLVDGDYGNLRNKPTLGTASSLNVAAAGANASTSQVVRGDDTRLTDSRPPTAHKATHATGGADALTAADIGAAAASHAHGNLTSAGLIGTNTASGQIVVTTTGGALTTADAAAARTTLGLGTEGLSFSYTGPAAADLLPLNDTSQTVPYRFALPDGTALYSGGRTAGPGDLWPPLNVNDLGSGRITSLSTNATSTPGGILTQVSFQTVPNLVSFSAPDLVMSGSIGASAALFVNLTTLSFPELVLAKGSILGTFSALTTLSFPKLRFASSLSITANAATTVSFPVLESATGNIAGQYNAVTSISFPELRTCGGIGLSSTALTTLAIPKLRTMSGSFSPVTPLLATLTLPPLGQWKVLLSSLSLTSGSLPQGSVDALLAHLAYMDGNNDTLAYGSSRVVQITGSNAAPSNLGSVTVTLATSPTLPNLVCSGTTCTVNMTAHGYAVGDVLRVSGVTGATNANRYAVVATVPNANQFTYTTVNTASPTNGAGQMNIVKASNNVKTLVTRGVSLTTM